MITTQPDYYEHPIFTPTALRLTTPAMVQLSEDIHRWLWTGATGALIIGKARIGKTTALLNLANQLHTRSKEKIPTYFVSIARRDTTTIASVFRQLCLSKNLCVTNRDRADHLSNRFIHYVADEAVRKDCAQAVLIVDEMQRLSLKQFDAFAELYDELLRRQIRLTTIFSGNDPECLSLLDQMNAQRYSHIEGRFFKQSGKVLGLISKQQVKMCLAQYDKLRYPLNGPTYTEFFLPKAVKKGWRLASLSDEIWRVFYQYKRELKIESWAMQYFIATINTLLIDFLTEQNCHDIDDEIIHECIRLSGVIPSLVSLK